MIETVPNPYSIINPVTQLLVIIGAINWGLIGTANFDIVKLLFKDTIFTRIIYCLVGLAGIVQLGYLAQLYL